MSSLAKENKMGVMPVHRLLISIALPMIISMLVQAMYNIVDSIFVAQYDAQVAALAGTANTQDGFTAVSIAFPIQNLMIAVGAGTGVGVNALLSRSLGEGNREEASRAANNGIFLAVLSFVAFFLFGILGIDLFIHAQTSNAAVAGYAHDYLSLCCMLSFGIFGQFIFERLLQATGKTFYTMITQGLGAIINIIFDWLFIFGIGPFPELGVKGAAVATVFGQIVAMCLAIVFNRTKNKEIHITLRHFRPNLRTIGRIYAVGVPSIIMGSIGSVMTFFLNMILNGLSAIGVTILGAYFKLQSFIFMPVFGLNNGMVPIVAYNYGAAKPDRIMKTIRLSVTYAVGMMLIGLALFQFVPDILLSFFELGGVPQAATALRIISWSFPFAGFAIIATSVFQALSHGFLSLMVSFGRQLVVLVPVAYLLSLSGSMDLVWWSFPIAEVMSLTLSIIFFVRLYKKEIKPLRTPA